jgi:transcriptional regulator with XRE-family HTH domain
MKMNIPKEWFEESAQLERGLSDEAGTPSSFLKGTAVAEPKAPAMGPELRVAFGRFVELKRRSLGFSVEQLAEKADVDPGELVTIETDLRHVPEPMTVFNLAKLFRTPEKSLMQLAGLVVAKDKEFVQAAVRFAAKSESIAKLTSQEQAALESFVAELNSRK